MTARPLSMSTGSEAWSWTTSHSPPTRSRQNVARTHTPSVRTPFAAALVALLDPAAVLTADGRGVVQAAPHPIHGAAPIADFLVEVARPVTATATVTLHEWLVNGRPGLLVRTDGATAGVYAFDVVEGRITRIWSVRNRQKLRLWDPEQA